jgi:hypothetical protein
MAGIETLTGITKINAFEYEVTSEVSVGASIDDLEYATFIQKSGGLLKFDSGCTTTFTNCKFVEETDAASAPQNKRFIANSSTAPVFKGCKFIVVHPFGTARGNSDFDVPTGANPTFDFSEDGSPCYFVRNNSGDIAEANHYYSGTFNSFVVDQNGNGGAFEVMSPSLTINDLTLKDRGLSNPLGSRHLIIYTSRSAFYNNTTTFRKLKSDNVSLFGGANTTDNNIIIKVIDAKGELLRSEDTPNSQRGYLQFLRTYQSAPLDATTLSAVSVKGYLKNTDNNDIIINGTTSGIDEELLQYKYEHNTTSTKEVITRDANGDPQTTGTFFTVANNYIRGFISYDRLPTSRTFKIEDRVDGSPLVHDVVLVDDSSITNTYASAKALTEITDANKFYDRAKAYLVDNFAGETQTIVTRDGNTIIARGYDVVVDDQANDVFAFNGTTITIKASSFVGNIQTTGTITLNNSAEVIGSYGANTVLPWEVTNVEATATLQLYNVTKSLEVENLVVTGTAGNKVTSSGTYTGSEVSVGDNIRLRITCQAGTSAFLPYEAFGVATSVGISFEANQVADTIYNDNGINADNLTTLSADYPNVQIDISDGDGIADAREFYAFYVKQTTTSTGIEQWFGAITAIDHMNYRVNTSVADIKLQNTGNTPLVISGARIFRDNGTSILHADAGDQPMTQDNGELIQYVKGQVNESLSNQLPPAVANAINSNSTITGIDKNSKLIPALL